MVKVVTEMAETVRTFVVSFQAKFALSCEMRPDVPVNNTEPDVKLDRLRLFEKLCRLLNRYRY